MSTQQVVVTISIGPIIARCFTEGTEVDPGLSQGILTRVLRDHLQAAYPKDHVSVGLHDSGMITLRIVKPSKRSPRRQRIRDIFEGVLQRENWLVSV